MAVLCLCVLVLLYVCPRRSYSYMCVLSRRRTSYSYMCVILVYVCHTRICASYSYMCVILVYVCHTRICVSYSYMCVILVYVCPLPQEYKLLIRQMDDMLAKVLHFTCFASRKAPILTQPERARRWRLRRCSTLLGLLVEKYQY